MGIGFLVYSVLLLLNIVMCFVIGIVLGFLFMVVMKVLMFWCVWVLCYEGRVV